MRTDAGCTSTISASVIPAVGHWLLFYDEDALVNVTPHDDCFTEATRVWRGTTRRTRAGFPHGFSRSPIFRALLRVSILRRDVGKNDIRFTQEAGTFSRNLRPEKLARERAVERER